MQLSFYRLIITVQLLSNVVCIPAKDKDLRDIDISSRQIAMGSLSNLKGSSLHLPINQGYLFLNGRRRRGLKRRHVKAFKNYQRSSHVGNPDYTDDDSPPRGKNFGLARLRHHKPTRFKKWKNRMRHKLHFRRGKHEGDEVVRRDAESAATETMVQRLMKTTTIDPNKKKTDQGMEYSEYYNDDEEDPATNQNQLKLSEAQGRNIRDASKRYFRNTYPRQYARNGYPRIEKSKNKNYGVVSNKAADRNLANRRIGIRHYHRPFISGHVPQIHSSAPETEMVENIGSFYDRNRPAHHVSYTPQMEDSDENEAEVDNSNYQPSNVDDFDKFLAHQLHPPKEGLQSLKYPVSSDDSDRMFYINKNANMTKLNHLRSADVAKASNAAVHEDFGLEHPHQKLAVNPGCCGEDDVLPSTPLKRTKTCTSCTTCTPTCPVCTTRCPKRKKKPKFYFCPTCNTEWKNEEPELDDDEDKNDNKEDCDLSGSWIAARAGLQFYISVDDGRMTVSATYPSQDTLPDPLLTPRWSFSGNPPCSPGSPFSILATNNQMKTIAVFVGACKVCEGKDTIRGVWLISREPYSCCDFHMATSMYNDMFKRTCPEKPKPPCPSPPRCPSCLAKSLVRSADSSPEFKNSTMDDVESSSTTEATELNNVDIED